jgi:hypothetical protein
MISPEGAEPGTARKAWSAPKGNLGSGFAPSLPWAILARRIAKRHVGLENMAMEEVETR